MYKRNKSVNSNFYLLSVVRETQKEEEEGEELATIYSEDPIPRPDEGETFDISLLQLTDEHDDFAQENDSFLITKSHQSYAIIENDDDHQALLNSTVVFVEYSEE